MFTKEATSKRKGEKGPLELASALLPTDIAHYFDGHLICIITLCNSLAICSKAFWTSSVNSITETGPPHEGSLGVRNVHTAQIRGEVFSEDFR